jgi:hypothetical protein
MDDVFPTLVMLPDVAGPIVFSEVIEDGRRVGWVWATLAAGVRPRAGIVLDSRVDPPSEELQSDLGAVSLRVAHVEQDDWDPIAWLDHLAASRSGLLRVQGRSEVESLDALRQLAVD